MCGRKALQVIAQVMPYAQVALLGCIMPKAHALDTLCPRHKPYSMPYAKGACLRCLMFDRRDQFIKSPRVKPIKGSTFKLQKTHPGVITIRSTKPDWATPERKPQSSSSSSLQRPRCFGSSYFRLLFFVFSSLCLGSILPAFM